jgi:hypothetical protein
MSKKHLTTYLNDHLSGAVAAIELLDHLAADAPEIRPSLLQLRNDIEADRKELEKLMERLDIDQSVLRKATAWIGEQVAETKLSMDDQTTGLLRRLERLEILSLGIEGKLSLWRALEAASKQDVNLRKLDYEGLARRAQDQRDRVEELRLDAARLALAQVA